MFAASAPRKCGKTHILIVRYPMLWCLAQATQTEDQRLRSYEESDCKVSLMSCMCGSTTTATTCLVRKLFPENEILGIAKLAPSFFLALYHGGGLCLTKQASSAGPGSPRIASPHVHETPIQTFLLGLRETGREKKMDPFFERGKNMIAKACRTI